MKKDFSPKWISSKQPRKQRKYKYNAPLHRRHKMLAAHLDKKLKTEYGKRSLPLRKGDEIAVMRGDYKGKTGTVSEVDMKRLKVYVENIKGKKTNGQEVVVPLEPSNLKITKLNIEDKFRRKFIERKKVSQKK
jgi:large subunit ribosomal protein L24